MENCSYQYNTELANQQLKDYRPISILPILSKVYKKEILHQITTSLKHSKFTTNTNLVIAKANQLQLSSQSYMTTSNWL